MAIGLVRRGLRELAGQVRESMKEVYEKTREMCEKARWELWPVVKAGFGRRGGEGERGGCSC